MGQLRLQYFIVHMHHFMYSEWQYQSYSRKCNIIRPYKDILLWNNLVINWLPCQFTRVNWLLSVGYACIQKGKALSVRSKHSSFWNHHNDGNASIFYTCNLIIIREEASLTLSIFIALLGCSLYIYIFLPTVQKQINHCIASETFVTSRSFANL